MHAWDEPVESLFALGPQQGVPLLMPRLGEAVEPAQFESARPWWRGVAPRRRGKVKPVAAPEFERLPKAMPWPLD